MTVIINRKLTKPEIRALTAVPTEAAERRLILQQNAWSIWRGINARCGKVVIYRDIENRYASLEALLADIGPRPSKEHTVDRINPFDHYRPGNCRWALEDVQKFNTREQWAKDHPEYAERHEAFSKRTAELLLTHTWYGTPRQEE